MNQGNSQEVTERIHFLCRITRKEVAQLESTAGRLFTASKDSLSRQEVEHWITDPVLSERLDAFVARFSRLQDTIGDKLIPAMLELSGESRGPAMDNLDKAEKFGWIDSADEWMLYRKLRNQMVHEYIEDTRILTDALAAGQQFVPTLIRLSLTVVDEAEKRTSKKR
jgi:hypothetical protein